MGNETILYYVTEEAVTGSDQSMELYFWQKINLRSFVLENDGMDDMTVIAILVPKLEKKGQKPKKWKKEKLLRAMEAAAAALPIAHKAKVAMQPQVQQIVSQLEGYPGSAFCSDCFAQDTSLLWFLTEKIMQKILPLPYKRQTQNILQKPLQKPIQAVVLMLGDTLFVEEQMQKFYDIMQPYFPYINRLMILYDLEDDVQRMNMQEDDIRWMNAQEDNVRQMNMQEDDVRRMNMREDDERRMKVQEDDVQRMNMREDDVRWMNMREDNVRWMNMQEDDERRMKVQEDGVRRMNMREDKVRWMNMQEDDERRMKVQEDGVRRMNMREDDVQRMNVLEDGVWQDREPGAKIWQGSKSESGLYRDGATWRGELMRQGVIGSAQAEEDNDAFATIEQARLEEAIQEYTEELYYEYGLVTWVQQYGKAYVKRQNVRIGQNPALFLDYGISAKIPFHAMQSGDLYLDILSSETKEALFRRKYMDISYFSPRKYLDTIVKSGYDRLVN